MARLLFQYRQAELEMHNPKSPRMTWCRGMVCARDTAFGDNQMMDPEHRFQTPVRTIRRLQGAFAFWSGPAIVIAVLVPAICAVGCGKPAAPPAGQTNPQAPLTQKLQGMTPEQRTEYVKSHMDEVAGAGSVGIPKKK
jgi:hypothetical protein